MVGISGTSKTGAMHYYYTCQGRRLNKTCDKANVRRDAIEEAVAKAIRDYILQDNVIQWIADNTVAYNKRAEEQSQISMLESELTETKHSIKNLMAAIEQGIITETTKARLLELEGEQAQLTGRIAAARADIVTVSRDVIVAGLEMYRDGNVKDKKYQARLFDTFLVAVYVYDDSFKIVFSFSGNKNTIRIPFDTSVIDSPEETAEASVRIEPLSVHQKGNPEATTVLGFFLLFHGF